MTEIKVDATCVTAFMIIYRIAIVNGTGIVRNPLNIEKEGFTDSLS